MGIFDKIYKMMNKESKEEREDREKKELEKERKLLFGPGPIKSNLQDLHSKYRNPLENVKNQNIGLVNTPPPHLMAPSIGIPQLPIKFEEEEVKLRERDNSPAPLSAREQAYAVFGSLTGTISTGLTSAKETAMANSPSIGMSFGSPDKDEDNNQ